MPNLVQKYISSSLTFGISGIKSHLEWIRRDYKKTLFNEDSNGDEDTGALDHQWNLFNLITSKTSDVRHHRFLLRLVLTGRVNKVTFELETE